MEEERKGKENKTSHPLLKYPPTQYITGGMGKQCPVCTLYPPPGAMSITSLLLSENGK